MKNHSMFFYIMSLFVILVGYSCDEEDKNELIVNSSTEDLAFTSVLQPVYSLDIGKAEEDALFLEWNELSFGLESAIVKHKVLGSVNEDFSTIDYESGGLNDPELTLQVKDLYNLAGIMGLDNDPKTTDANGNPNNTGTVYFRVETYVGNYTAVNVVKAKSSVVSLNLEIVEVAACPEMLLSEWGFVGPFNDWDITTPVIYSMLTTGNENVFKGALSIDDGGFKITVLDGSWSKTYAYGGTEGSLMENVAFEPVIPSSAGHYVVTADLSSLTYSMEEAELIGLVGPSTVNQWDGPDYKLIPDGCQAGVHIGRNIPLTSGTVYFRVNDDWTVSYSLGDKEGTIIPNPGIGSTGIPVAEDGNYDVIVDLNTMSYELIKL
ncbi:SusE domain-containing protein [Marinilabilia rubra]|uniref:Uncharacterized protein n=1 Tax=Marinilabilia rubra TaxID=2162893 RepID=A0A2U2BC26_9BACT|nr:SusE domain-containing protein [Marinilabilia rubra]PWE00618.1 hypothetical protein DDZ16_03190 [Marinilabilia rubra]